MNKGKSENPKAPDFRVYKSKPREESSEVAAAPAAQEEVDELI